ncbi:MAG: hypothetical protein ACO3NA_01935 [Flavobacteriaceae bacterium]|nr:hypothetical protein [Flavobacteriaceae bacterium]
MPSRIKSIFFFGFFLIFFSDVNAQCAMCRAVLESGSDTSAAKGINNGIVYLMAIPYILVGVVFYAVYKRLRPTKHP